MSTAEIISLKAVEPGRDAVLLLHGLQSTPMEMQYLAREAFKAGYAVHCPTIPGYAHSIGGRNARRCARYESWVESVVAEFDRLRQLYRSVSVAGLCIGANLALALAARRRGQVKALSLLSTTLYYDGWNISPWRVLLPIALHTPIRRWLGYRETPPYGVKNPRIREWIARQMSAGAVSAAGAATIPMEAVYQAQRLIRHVKQALPGVIAPTLLVHARQDDVTSLRSPRFVESSIGAKLVRTVVLEDSYHMVTLDNQRDLVARKTLQFFDFVTGRKPQPSAAARTVSRRGAGA